MSHSRISSATDHKVQVQVNLPLSYHHFNLGKDKPLLIFFHGYTDTAAGFLKRAMPELFHRFEIVAPNAPFPLPQKIEGGWRQSFAWYFADFKSGAVLLHPEVAASAIEQLVAKLDLVDRPKILIGFSQGGFFLPFVYPKLQNVLKLIAVGSAYRPEDYQESLLSIPLDAIHGTEDEVIAIEQAAASFESMKEKNPEGLFFKVENLKHTMNAEARDILINCIDIALKK